MAKTQAESNMEDPKEFAAWAFAAGIPDARSGMVVQGKAVEFPHQPLIPPANFGAVSQMLWDLGFRHHDDLQTKWVKPPVQSFGGNFEAWGITDDKPDLEALAAQMVTEEFPGMAERLAKVTPEKHKEALRVQVVKLQDSLKRLKEAQANATESTVAPEAVTAIEQAVEADNIE